MDWFFQLDVQKDWIINTVSSVKLNPEGTTEPIRVVAESWRNKLCLDIIYDKQI